MEKEQEKIKSFKQKSAGFRREYLKFGLFILIIVAIIALGLLAINQAIEYFSLVKCVCSNNTAVNNPFNITIST